MQAVQLKELKYVSALDAASDGDTDPGPLGKKFDHVLVALDGSDFSRAALPTARALAERFGAELHTIGMGPDGPVGRGAEIVGRATELGSSVVCLSTRARGRIAGAFRDSVASAVLRGSGRPIVAVGPMAERPGWDPGPRGWPKPLSANRIVVCVDGTAESEGALPEAAVWASALGKTLTILTVVDDAPEPLRPGPGTVDHRSPYGAEEYIESLVERWEAPTLEVDGLVLRDPIGPASAIRNHLAERPAALVALIAPDRRRWHRIRLGATAEQITRTSPAPCLLVPRKP